jgi:hypothetical protein
METKTQDAVGEQPAGAPSRRKKRSQENGALRFFLPKAGSSPAKPELGQEMASESEALIEAFKSGQTFYTLSAWKAVPEVNGGSNPVIVKQALART